MTTPDPAASKPPLQPGKAGLPTLPGDQATIMTDLRAKADPTAATRPPAGRPPSEHSALTVMQTGGAPLGDDLRGQVWGDFAIESLLGRGGMGAVWRARQVSLDRPVAIKVLPAQLSSNEQFRNRFALEAKAVAQISSPHVIQVYAAGQHQGHHYFAMEFVEGVDLGKRLKDGYKPTYREALDLVTQAARGLAAAGEHGIVHRDIKPANMMITAKGVLKLMDFGLVKLASANDGLTMAGTIMGTVSYFSPEQGRGDSCDQRTDVYALGIVFYELLTGKLPFTGADATSVIYQHIHQPPRLPKEIDPQIPEDYQAVVLKCLQKDPRGRYPNADDLLSDLADLAEGRKPQTAFIDAGSLRQGGTIVKSPPFSGEAGRRRWPAVVAVLLVAAAAAGVAGRRHLVGFAAAHGIAQSRLGGTHGADPASPLGDPVASLERARKLLGDQLYDEARRIVERERRERPDDAQWTQLGQDLDAREADAASAQAEAALARGDDAAAETAVARAQALAPLLPRARAVAALLAERVGKRRTRQHGIEQVQALLAEGQPERAQELLATLAADFPEDGEIAGLAKRAASEREDVEARQRAVRDHLDQGEQALNRGDLDAALMAFTAARQYDPKSARAADGLARVDARKQRLSEIRTAFEAALAARDLAGAEARLAELRSEAPGSAMVVLAENELTNSKLVEDASRKRDDERAAQAAARAAEALAAIADAKQPIADAERAVADFQRAWAGRPEVARLERALDDRRARDAAVAMLARLDAAVLAKDAATVRALVRDAEFSQRLADLMAMDGLVFQTTAGAFTREGEDATIAIQLRNALPTYPESVLPGSYRLKREQGAWVVVAADLKP